MTGLNLIKHIITHPLNSDAKIKTILRFTKWQSVSRLRSGTVVWNWIDDSRFYVRHAEYGLTGNIYLGLHEYQEMAYLLHALRPDDLFVDVGANAGSYTILASSVVGAQTVAFEPVPSVYKRLMANIGLNKIQNRVKALNTGIGNKAGLLQFTSNMDVNNHALISEEKNEDSISVQMMTLDQALKNESPAIVKIDVEGYETAVLQGAKETLINDSLHTVIVELNGSGKRYGYRESNILDMMCDNGFRAYAYDPMTRCLKPLDGKNPDSRNTLFIRKADAVLEKIENAPKIFVNGRYL